ncbi:MAG: hypothetical protein O7G86_12165, partial [Gammaproteobacteria bacterium]|nr:hypothetical protein [Gammaproteobacteria bacterium]
QTISQDFEAAAGFIRRTDIIRMDQRVRYTTWPDRGGWLVSWGPKFEIGHVWDSDGKQLDEDIEAGIEWEFPRQTKLEINVSHASERLTVDEFPVLAIDREYDASSIEVEYGTSWWKNFSVYGETSFGKGINFSPLEGLEPNPVDWLQSNLKIALKPLTQLAIDTSLIYTLFENDSTGARVLEDLIARTRLNWQFSRELSLRSIIQFERTSPNPLETTITDRENWNLDLLLTYRLNPWTAVYFGYNTNRQNIDIVEQGGVPTIVRTSGLHKDSEQWLLKFSYLLRP